MRSFRRNNRINYSTTKINTRKVIGWKISAFESPSYSVYRHVSTETPGVTFVDLPKYNETSIGFEEYCNIYETFSKTFLKARLDGNFTMYLNLSYENFSGTATVALKCTPLPLQ